MNSLGTTVSTLFENIRRILFCYLSVFGISHGALTFLNKNSSFYMQATNELTFLSLNVRGLSNNRKRAAVFAWCKRQGADVLFLQETHSTKSSEKTWEKCWGNTIYFSHGKSNARGTCILIKPSLKIDVEKQTTDSMED